MTNVTINDDYFWSFNSKNGFDEVHPPTHPQSSMNDIDEIMNSISNLSSLPLSNTG